MRHLVLLTMLLALPVHCFAEIYKWVDDKGQPGYSDDLGKVPKKYRDRVIVNEAETQAVEIVENNTVDTSGSKNAEQKAVDKDIKGKDKQSFDGKNGEAWKRDMDRARHEVKSLEDQLVGIKERMADGSKISRGEFLTLQNTERDLNIRISKAQKKLDALSDAADRASVPSQFR